MEKEKKVILIVEDEIVLSQAMSFKFVKEGFEVKTASNGAEALKVLKEGSVDFMILDLIMPVMNGFDVIETMNKEHLSVPLVVLSNLGQKEDTDKIALLGVSDYHIKANTPISELVLMVKEKLAKK